MRLFAYRSASTSGRSGSVQSGRGGFGDAFPVGVDVDGVTFAQVAADGRIATDHGPVERSSLTAGAAVAKPGKIVCVGLNYGDHVREGAGREVPQRPLLFSKFANAVIADGEAVVRPPGTHALDLEVELGVVIGRRARRVSVEDARRMSRATWSSTTSAPATGRAARRPSVRARRVTASGSAPRAATRSCRWAPMS